MVQCTICGQETTDLPLHLRTHHGNSYLCLICLRKTYPIHGTLLRHQRDQHGLPHFEREEWEHLQRAAFIPGIQPAGPTHHPPRSLNTRSTTATASSTASASRSSAAYLATPAPGLAVNSPAAPIPFPSQRPAPTPLPTHLSLHTPRPSLLPPAPTLPPPQTQFRLPHQENPPQQQQQQPSPFGYAESLIDPTLLQLHNEQQREQRQRQSTNQAPNADSTPTSPYHKRQER